MNYYYNEQYIYLLLVFQNKPSISNPILVSPLTRSPDTLVGTFSLVLVLVRLRRPVLRFRHSGTAVGQHQISSQVRLIKLILTRFLKLFVEVLTLEALFWQYVTPRKKYIIADKLTG